MQEPPPLCDFEQWIDTAIAEDDKKYLDANKKWDEERKERWEREKKQEEAAREHREEERRRAAAKRKGERQKKLERARRAKAALEEYPDAQRKGKWPRCTQ